MKIHNLYAPAAAVSYITSGITIATSIVHDNPFFAISGACFAVAGTGFMVAAIKQAERSETNKKS